MKTIVVVFLLSLAVPLWAQSTQYVKNGDFADGVSHWEGDVKNGADLAGSDPDIPAGTKGLIVKLSPKEWTKFSQEVTVPSDEMDISMTLTLSQGTAFSDKQEDYENPPQAMGILGFAFHGHQGAMLNFVHNVDVMTDRFYRPYLLGEMTPGTSKTLKFIPYKHLTPGAKYLIIFAFPSGHGVVNITNISAGATFQP